MELYINNRRYIGSKTSLLDKITNAVEQYYGTEKATFADLFAGTGVVAEHFANRGYDTIVNDFLLSNYIAYETWISNDDYDEKKVAALIKYYNHLDPQNMKDNYFSDKFGEKYFSYQDAKIIGYIRDDLESKKEQLTKREFCMILTSLMYATDKIANTVGHFEHYLSKKTEDKGIELRIPKIEPHTDSKITIYHEDANQLVRKIKTDIAYIDPPYNARQYINFYHVLENLVRWEKPEELEGTSMKFKRNHLKSDYSKSKAPQVFEDLIENLDAKLIIVSYNNTYNAKSGASNNKISEAELARILNKKGDIEIVPIDYKSFNAGKTNFNNHQEKLYICKVRGN